MRPRNSGNLTPNDLPFSARTGARNFQALNTLRIEIDLTATVLHQPAEELCNGALRSMAAVHEGRGDGDTQVRQSAPEGQPLGNLAV